MAYLSEREADHEKLFIPWIQKDIDQKNCVCIVTKILSQEGETYQNTAGFSGNVN